MPANDGHPIENFNDGVNQVVARDWEDDDEEEDDDNDGDERVMEANARRDAIATRMWEDYQDVLASRLEMGLENESGDSEDNNAGDDDADDDDDIDEADDL